MIAMLQREQVRLQGMVNDVTYETHVLRRVACQRYLDDDDLSVTLFLDGLEAIAALVANGIGASLMPMWSGLEQLTKDFTIVPVGDGYDRDIALVTRADTDRPLPDWRYSQSVINGPSRYCSSVTGSIQSVFFPSTVSVIAKCDIAVVAAAPCQ